MFTGLVQGVGTAARVTDNGYGGRTLHVSAPAIVPHLVLGESVAVDGVCLTVAGWADEVVVFQVGPETVTRTTLGGRTAGDGVNLERALRVGDALGGHFVTGHVDCVGRVVSREQSGDWETVRFEIPPGYDELLVMKGSVAVDGVSLTVADVRPGGFGVMLIPHTLANTTLGDKHTGSDVNLEFDILAKHVRKLFHSLTIKA